MAKVSIFEYVDGYCAVGYEGQKKLFIPQQYLNEVLDKVFNIHLHLDSEIYIRKTDKSLKENFND